MVHVGVAEDPSARVGVDEVGQGHALQDSVLDADTVKDGHCGEHRAFDPQGVGQPRREPFFYLVALSRGYREHAGPHGLTNQAEEPMMFAIAQQFFKLPIGDFTELGVAIREQSGNRKGSDRAPRGVRHVEKIPGGRPSTGARPPWARLHK